MTALAVAHPRSARSRAAHLRPVQDLPAEPPVTVTISIAGGTAGRDQVLAALRDLVDVAGPAVEVTVAPGEAPGDDGGIRLDPQARTAQRAGQALELSR